MPQPPQLSQATASPAWKVLNPGGDEPLILAVDFAVSGRPEATFTSLSPLLAAELPLWETRQPDPEQARSFGGEDFTEYWAQAVRATGRPVRAVLGYCVGGLYAARLAHLVARGQDTRPQVVLFDPEPPSAAGMTADFRDAMARISSVLTPEESERAIRTAAEAATDFTTFRAFGTTLTRTFREAATSAFARAELLPELADELSTAYEMFVRYIASAADLDPAELWPDTTAVTSPTAAPHPGRSIPVDVPHADLLRSPATAGVVRTLLE
ncbi:hypothetical protein [Streptomyces sp. NRRL S-646]|uniref:hypothetical protein n=1 Tax=Streptomyces sp. NRRL S-646 TaxID=1463917 RepID=UPI0004CB3528|nr:hypothetical protein [Streptomyces sp. NRRL S-646]